MLSRLEMTLLGFGIIFLSFGATIVVIELLGAHFGTPHKLAPMVGGAFLVVGAVLAAGGIFLHRSRGASRAS